MDSVSDADYDNVLGIQLEIADIFFFVFCS